MIKRQLANRLLHLSKKFRVVTITGPRQSGKTTFAKAVFSGYDYVSLENPDTRLLAQEDPRGFLQNHPGKCIIDEIQLVPGLLSYIQTMVDKENTKGRFILTGSQNLMLLEKITQSLAGRTAILKLLPLSLPEITNLPNISLPDSDEIIFKGFVTNQCQN